MAMYGGHRARSSYTLMRVGLACIVLLLVVAFGAAYALIEFKTGIRAYATGESLWSKGRQTAVYHLNRYTDTGDPAHLDDARQGLITPLAYRDARQAMTRTPMDAQRASDKFLEGGSHPGDVSHLIRVYRFMGHSSLFHTPLQIWRDADPLILRLSEMVQLLAENQFNESQHKTMRAEIDRLNRNLAEMEASFSESLGHIDRTLNRILLLTVTTVLALAGLLVTAFFMSAGRRMAHTEDELRTTLERAAVGMARVSLSGTIRSANHQFGKTVGYPEDSLEGMQLDQLLMLSDGENRPELRTVQQRVLRDGTYTLSYEEPWTRADGTPLWLEFTFSAVRDRKDRLTDYILVVDDISRHRNQMEKLSYEASHDALTGAINRREFLNRLSVCLESAWHDHSRHSLCFIDLDLFKDINDTYGHQAGDDCLIELCSIIRSQLRQGDILARLGGDEFALILTHCPVDVAQRLAEELRRSVAAFSFHSGNHTFNLTLSIGVTEVRGDLGGPESVMAAADQACYGAKEQGRNHAYAVSLASAGA